MDLVRRKIGFFSYTYVGEKCGGGKIFSKRIRCEAQILSRFFSKHYFVQTLSELVKIRIKSR